MVGGHGLNPSVTIMLQFVNAIIRDGPVRDVPILLFGPICGAMLAGIIFNRIYEPLVILHKLDKKRERIKIWINHILNLDYYLNSYLLIN